MTNDRLNAPPSSTTSQPSYLVETPVRSRQYEPNYAYPLLVLLHPRGDDEDQLVRAMPAFAGGDYAAWDCGGPEPVIKRDRLAGFGWGRDYGLHERRDASLRPRWTAPRPRWFGRPFPTPSRTTSIVSRRGCSAAIRNTRSLLHVHSERIFLVGCGEGLPSPIDFGLTYPERFAGWSRQRLAPFTASYRWRA